MDGYRKVAKALGGIRRYGEDTPIPLTRILEIRGLEDALCCLRNVLPEEQGRRDILARLLACNYAEHIAPRWQAPIGIVWKPSDTIEVVRRFARGEATTEELRTAEASAEAVADRSEGGVAPEVGWVARAAAAAAAPEASAAAAWVAVWAAENEWQTQEFVKAMMEEKG